MSMYSTWKEIPPALLERLRERPWDAEFVDSLLFVEQDGAMTWSPAAQRSTLTDEVLRARFSSPHVQLTLEQMRQLGELDEGKYDSSGDTPSPFDYLLRTAEADRAEQLACVLRYAKGGRSLVEMQAELDGLFGAPKPPRPSRRAPLWLSDEGEPRYCFATEVPTYGINSYAEPGEALETWRTLERVLDLYPQHRGEALALFADEVAYFYGCAARGGAQLWVLW